MSAAICAPRATLISYLFILSLTPSLSLWSAVISCRLNGVTFPSTNSPLTGTGTLIYLTSIFLSVLLLPCSPYSYSLSSLTCVLQVSKLSHVWCMWYGKPHPHTHTHTSALGNSHMHGCVILSHRKRKQKEWQSVHLYRLVWIITICAKGDAAGGG